MGSKSKTISDTDILVALRKSRDHWWENVGAKTHHSIKAGCKDCALCALYGRQQFVMGECGRCILNPDGSERCCAEYHRVAQAMRWGNSHDAHAAALVMWEKLDRLVKEYEAKVGSKTGAEHYAIPVAPEWKAGDIVWWDGTDGEGLRLEGPGIRVLMENKRGRARFNVEKSHHPESWWNIFNACAFRKPTDAELDDWTIFEHDGVAFRLYWDGDDDIVMVTASDNCSYLIYGDEANDIVASLFLKGLGIAKDDPRIISYEQSGGVACIHWQV